MLTEHQEKIRKAWANGESIEFKTSNTVPWSEWILEHTINLNSGYWRLKPKHAWTRTVFAKNGHHAFSIIVRDPDEPQCLPDGYSFREDSPWVLLEPFE